VQSKQAGTSLGGSANTARPLLLDRTVLDTPIVIPVGEYAAIKYSIKVNMTE
jgi:queuine/archaeosine tRNA-ribosyltransferase